MLGLLGFRYSEMFSDRQSLTGLTPLTGSTQWWPVSAPSHREIVNPVRPGREQRSQWSGCRGVADTGRRPFLHGPDSLSSKTIEKVIGKHEPKFYLDLVRFKATLGKGKRSS